MKQQILIDALKAQYRQMARETVVVQYVKNHFNIMGNFPSAYDIAQSMYINLDMAQRCLDKARKSLWRGLP